MRLPRLVMTRATDVPGSHVNPTGTTCGEPSGRSVVNVARWRTDRNSRAAEDRSRGRVATRVRLRDAVWAVPDVSR